MAVIGPNCEFCVLIKKSLIVPNKKDTLVCNYFLLALQPIFSRHILYKMTLPLKTDVERSLLDHFPEGVKEIGLGLSVLKDVDSAQMIAVKRKRNGSGIF